MRGNRAVIVGLLAAGLVVGCGGSPAGEVSGTVTYDGTPVENGAIAFHPAAGKGPSAGGTVTGGKYAVTNVPAGTAKVRISGVKDAKKKKMYDDPKAELVQTSAELLPPKYSDDKATELRYDVTAGTQTKDFTLAK